MNANPALVRPRFASEHDPKAALLIARLSLSYPAALQQLNEGLYSEEMRTIIGITPTDGKLSKIELRKLMKIRADELDQKLPRRKTALARNIEMMGKLLGLDAVQQEIVAFAALSQHHPYLAEVIETIRIPSSDAFTKLLSTALKVSDAEITKAIRPDGQMLATSIACLEFNALGSSMQIVLPPGVRTALFTRADNIQMLMRSFLEPAPPPRLDSGAFSHLHQETELLTTYLSKASLQGMVGVNILMYGPPGTGKTEYARWLATQQRKPLFQVRAADDQGEAISGHDRLAFFQLSQRFLHKSGALMLFDEIEDVFPTDTMWGALARRGRPTAGKMYINRVLENNPVPAIWIANEVSHIDKAYLRRFDFSFEMGIPPVAVRRGILSKYLSEHRISDKTMNYLAQQEQLTPAQIEKAAKVMTLSGVKGAGREATLLQVIENSMALLDQAKNDAFSGLAECNYQLDYLNPDCDLPQLLAQLKRAPKSVGALCFYGAPGTGKTALAHYIARETQSPLLVRRASDILSPYVGETEQKIARMFGQAAQDGAILLLDEADSFLTERQSAKNSWEVTAVNEMLTQMERFDGLFICSTNLMQRLDAASLRRFALKIKFDYLKPEQRWRLFLAQAEKVHRALEAGYRAALNQLNNLTPGDFATVRRQVALLSVTLSADELLKRLQHECKSKSGGNKQPIGFIHDR